MVKSRRIKRRKKSSGIWKPIITFTALLIGLGIVAMGAWCFYLSYQIDKRFSSRRWSIPSRVYSDTTFLYPGQVINRELFDRKLRGLGYREVPHLPAVKGEMRRTKSGLTLFLRDLDIPDLTREGFPVTLRFNRNRLESLTRRDTGTSLPILELGPEEIMRFFGPEREQRQIVSIREVPEHLIHAVLAAEDHRFYEHHGVDFRGILRALVINIRHGGIRQGGSTLTQQLAKNYFLTPERTLSRKFKELILAVLIEAKYTKDDVLEIYLNEIYLGQNGSVSINGVEEASLFYFDKPVRDLSLAETATLAGLIKGPNLYSPYADAHRCLDRRNIVLQAMFDRGWISREALDTAAHTPMKPSGYRRYTRQAPYFIDYLSGQVTELYSPASLASLGLSIYTTLNTQVQQAAEEALEQGLIRLEKADPRLSREDTARRLQGAVVVMQPKTGAILAMVGGRSYGGSQFNRITQARRQPGSTFKPFVYLTGLDAFTPASQLSNSPRFMEINGETWAPKNFSPNAPPIVTFRQALAQSHNLATIDLAMQVGLDEIVQTAKTFQISTPLRPYPSLTLGAFEVIPMELARAFSVFAADGILPFPLSLKEITDEEGDILERRNMTITRLISPEKAFMMNSLLQSVVETGTAKSLGRRGIHFPVAGKTGTTNDTRDAWFIGYTPDLLALVWVGFDDGSPVHATGGTAALPIWADLMKRLPQLTSGAAFRKPRHVVQLTVCSESGELAVDGKCPSTVTEFFLEENAPSEPCPLHAEPGTVNRIFNGFKNTLKRAKDMLPL